MSSSVTYRQLILRLPEGLKEAMRARVSADTGMDGDGVDFCPVKKGSRRFNFTMDGKTYPARLVDLPCVLESQKTLDRSTFFKSGDIGQMLIVYKDDAAYKRDDGNSSGSRGFYANGLSPPTMDVVRRRFLKARPDQGKFDPSEVIRVESQVLKMQQDPTEASDRAKKAGPGGGAGSLNGSGNGGTLEGANGGGAASKPAVGGNALRKGVIGDSGKGTNVNGDGDRVTIEHEEIVPFEPWMADPDIATVGRLEGITIEIKGATDVQDAAAARERGAASSSPTYGRVGGVEGGGALPRLFGHELLYEHPEMLLSTDETPEDPTLRPSPDPEPKATSPVPPGKPLKRDAVTTSAPGSTSAGSAPSSRTGNKEKRRSSSTQGSGAGMAPAAAQSASTMQDSTVQPSEPPGATGAGGNAAGALESGNSAKASPEATGDLPLDPDISSAVMSALEESDLLDSVPVDLFSGLPAGDDEGTAGWGPDD